MAEKSGKQQVASNVPVAPKLPANGATGMGARFGIANNPALDPYRHAPDGELKGPDPRASDLRMAGKEPHIATGVLGRNFELR